MLFEYSFFNMSGFKAFNSSRTQEPFTLSILWWYKWKDVEMVSNVTKKKLVICFHLHRYEGKGFNFPG